MPTFRAPARISLNVRVVGIHEDGSPDIVALSQTVDLCDNLLVENSESDRFPDDFPEISEAVQVYRNVVKDSFPISIDIENNIPLHVDLGMEYSRAATTLWALNQLAPHPLSDSALKQLAASIHPNLQFYFTGGTAKCSGFTGSTIEEVQPGKMDPFWLVCPPFKVSPENIFRRHSKVDLQDHDLDESLSQLINSKARYFNDLEESAFALNPRLALIRQRVMDQGFSTVVMSGTGPALICMDGPAHRISQEQSYQTQPLNRTAGNWY